MSEKLTQHQNQKITEALCELAVNGHCAEEIKQVRWTLVSECEKINLATREDALQPRKFRSGQVGIAGTAL